MTTMLLFHHAQGQTTGFLSSPRSCAWRATRSTPPICSTGGRSRTSTRAWATPGRSGSRRYFRRGVATADELAPDIVYAGFSLGVMPAQSLAQRRDGARGALLYSAALPASEFGEAWPQGVPVQVHMMDADPWAEEDRPAAEALVKEAQDAELFLYPGSGHLFADPSLDDHDEPAATLLKERTLAFLDRVG